jgi:hypothetical protein
MGVKNEIGIRQGSVSEIEGAAPRPCAFYVAAMPGASRKQAPTPERATLKHRCLLNPGRSVGPDGEGISPMLCTPERQNDCQAQRREALARLYATLPANRPAA